MFNSKRLHPPRRKSEPETRSSTLTPGTADRKYMFPMGPKYLYSRMQGFYIRDLLGDAKYFVLGHESGSRHAKGSR